MVEPGVPHIQPVVYSAIGSATYRRRSPFLECTYSPNFVLPVGSKKRSLCPVTYATLTPNASSQADILGATQPGACDKEDRTMARLMTIL